MYDFSHQKVSSVAGAVAAIQNAEDGKFIAGGQTMLPTMKHRLASPSDLIDLGGITELNGINVDGDVVIIGAMTTHAAVAASSEVQNTIPALAQLAGNIGDPAVRNRGTIGGSIANNDPAADYPAAVIALDAVVKTSKREIPGNEFFTGMFETALEEDEIITAVMFSKPDVAAYMKFENPASRYAIVGVFVARAGDSVRVGITGATPCAHRGIKLEESLNADFSGKAIEGVEIPVEKMNSDIHASAEYRAHLVKVMAKRAVEACA
ncbi:MAG: xanthine dehydrogenase family protein subunit M [Pseudomonadales bacterium]|jgi:carbon-monoxide dehydrogenase medium subunit|nr:xanthine dehydrogenase family protein subunit M [Pseudomonadales bacterium]MDP6314635.1 xanthine dehydrogenase family protein subunit M [Pseudomonadales bacterium]MDP7313384.1 xanthine dehydrogenase family protein subunit M [Pseudomonadales bacterium]MDP7576649.1 xanthine dehydrogenase family protein subunit M [Pseudomonadales bacterium]HJP50013.1 xanthine dehydrogenase family protein subunit M [Pseudomonadales bacterium]|tara:strand:- start:881 stop:1675 length:795 start_codon:yes stop_codon:yes gene_type:complete